ncbi:MAG: HD domain-containing protein [Anaerolineae bacterium]|nr:HD domain-containing protein [Anaerolineae bacterium]
MLKRIVYRAGQFFRAMWPRVREDEYALVEVHLSASEMALFCRMHRIDQRHCLDVFYSLYRAGYRDAVLLQAALLHDVGKAAGQITIVHRVAVVLMQRIVPSWLEQLAQDGRGWKRGFAVHVSHPEIGARLLKEAGSSQVAFLVKGHHDSDPHDSRLVALHWADGQH